MAIEEELAQGQPPRRILSTAEKLLLMKMFPRPPVNRTPISQPSHLSQSSDVSLLCPCEQEYTSIYGWTGGRQENGTNLALAPVVLNQIRAEPVVEVQRWALRAVQVQPVQRSDVPEGVVANGIPQVHQRVLIPDTIERSSILALLDRVLDQVALVHVELAARMTVELTVRPALRRCGRKVPYSIVSHKPYIYKLHIIRGDKIVRQSKARPSRARIAACGHEWMRLALIVLPTPATTTPGWYVRNQRAKLCSTRVAVQDVAAAL